MSALLDSLQSGFAATQEGVGVVALRRQLLARALEQGLPTQRNERWKYTALRALSARRFVTQAETPRVHPAAISDIPSPRLVFVNGRFDAAMSDLATLPAGVAFGPLALAEDRNDAAASSLPDEAYRDSGDAFALLNGALATDGASLCVAAGVIVESPLHLVFLGVPAAGDIASHARHCIELGAKASLSVVEHHLGTGAHRHLSNHLFKIDLGAGATLVHARLQDEDAGATVIERVESALDAGALYHRVDLELGGGLSRNEVNVSLRGERARVLSGGALLAGDRRHVDTRLAVEHAARDTTCELLWRGLAAERGRIAFHGGITIQAGADGSDARLSNKNLLLSDRAEIDTQPVLEIHADEVKAAHGATVGRLDATSLFYLRSRGIPLAQARVLLTLTFCREALASIADPRLVEMLSPRLETRLAALEDIA